jgi:hypothetical protein
MHFKEKILTSETLYKPQRFKSIQISVPVLPRFASFSNSSHQNHVGKVHLKDLISILYSIHISVGWAFDTLFKISYPDEGLSPVPRVSKF